MINWTEISMFCELLDHHRVWLTVEQCNIDKEIALDTLCIMREYNWFPA